MVRQVVRYRRSANSCRVRGGVVAVSAPSRDPCTRSTVPAAPMDADHLSVIIALPTPRSPPSDALSQDLVFNGGLSRSRRVTTPQPRLLAMGGYGATVSDLQSFAIVSATNSCRSSRDEDNRVNNRLRVDEYEVALSATDDVPKTLC